MSIFRPRPDDEKLDLPDGTTLNRRINGNLHVIGRDGETVVIENADFYRVMVWMFDSYLEGPGVPRNKRP